MGVRQKIFTTDLIEQLEAPQLIRKMEIGIGLILAILLFVGFLSYRTVVASRESNERVRPTHVVLENLEALLSAVQDVETRNRNFALTGDEHFREMYSSGLLRAAEEEKAIQVLTIDNASQGEQLIAFRDLMEQKIRYGDELNELRQSRGEAAAVEKIRGGQGLMIMGDIRRVVGSMEDQEHWLLVQREREAERQAHQTEIGVVVGCLLAILIACGAGWTIQRGLRLHARAKEALGDSEEKYRMLVDGIQNYAIFMLDPQGRVVSWNSGAQRIKGYPARQIIGHNFACFFPPEDVKKGRPEEMLRMTAASGKHDEQSMRVRKDGSRFLAHITLTALHDSTGELRGFSEVSQDLSESKESEARYRGLLEAAPDAMVVVNQGGEIVLLNVQVEKQFGYRRDELVGQKVKNIIPEGFAERLIADALRSAPDALAQQIGTGIELLGKRKDGSEFPIEIMLSPLESAEGILVTAAIRNITNRKIAEQNLLEKVEELNRSNQELGQFAYIASHDLQEPLRMVASYTQLLATRYRGKLGSDADEFIAFAVDGAIRMQELIQDLLEYSSVGTRGKDLVTTSSEEALQEALRNLCGSIEKSGAQVTRDLLPKVLADKTQLTQLFQNLVGNGIKYQSHGVPQIHVSAAKNGEQKWTFSVRDNVLGIEPQYFEKIFGMFQRLHKREDFPGTGIGLAICKKIVERHGGNISVESKPGEGSTFSFELAAS